MSYVWKKEFAVQNQKFLCTVLSTMDSSDVFVCVFVLVLVCESVS